MKGEILFTIFTTLYVATSLFLLPYIKHRTIQYFFANLFSIYCFQLFFLIPEFYYLPSWIKLVIAAGRFSNEPMIWLLSCYFFRPDFKIKICHLLIVLTRIVLGLGLYYNNIIYSRFPTLDNVFDIVKSSISIGMVILFFALIFYESWKGFQSDFIQKKKKVVIKIFFITTIYSIGVMLLVGIHFLIIQNKVNASFFSYIGIFSLGWYVAIYLVGYEGIMELVYSSKNINTVVDKNKEIHQKIFDFMKNSEIYKNQNISLKKLAYELSLHPNDLRHIILYELEGFSFKTFPDFINYFRVEEAKKILKNNQNEMNILNLGYEVGFNSPATFYRAFQKFTGKSPKDFQNE